MDFHQPDYRGYVIKKEVGGAHFIFTSVSHKMGLTMFFDLLRIRFDRDDMESFPWEADYTPNYTLICPKKAKTAKLHPFLHPLLHLLDTCAN
jgi:hypothetical protein